MAKVLKESERKICIKTFGMMFEFKYNNVNGSYTTRPGVQVFSDENFDSVIDVLKRIVAWHKENGMEP